MNQFLIITGASSGIGAATAQKFLDNQWTVINISRRSCSHEGVVNILTDLSGLTPECELYQKLNELIPESAKICLIHNAFAYYKDNVETIRPEEFRHVLEVSLIAPVIINQWLISKMQHGSSIIYIGSTLSEKAVPNAASYSVAKHAIAGLMRATCQDLADKKIHTVCICPGFTDTEMLKTHLNNDPAIVKMITDKVCFKRLIEPPEMADTIYFAAQSSILNGAMIHANLGQVEL